MRGRITRALMIVVFAKLSFAGVPALADMTFPVSIRGVIYSAGAPPVRVRCDGRQGNTVTFIGADVTVDTLPMFNFDTSCQLHSAQGVFTDGERFNGVVIDQEGVVDIVTNSRGGEVNQSAALREGTGSGPGTIEIMLQYIARFPIDRTTGMLQPPLRSVRGSMTMVNDSTNEIFVGSWRTGRPF